jgi:hypothetical protein
MGCQEGMSTFPTGTRLVEGVPESRRPSEELAVTGYSIADTEYVTTTSNVPGAAEKGTCIR